MKKENILVLALVCIAFGGILIYNQTQSFYPSTDKKEKSSANGYLIDWQDFDAGMHKAKNQNKPVFLYFYADWCTYCNKLKKTTFKDKTVLTFLEDHFISIKVDTDVEKDLATQWNVRGLPTLWFLQSDSTKIDSIPGYIDKKQFLSILKFIQTESYSKISFNEFIESN